MNEPNIEPLILDLIEWLAARASTYGEVMDAWRTSCPRLTVWEDATERGLVEIDERNGMVRPTVCGLALLRASRLRADLPAV